MSTKNGLDALLARDCAPLRGKAIGVVCNQASIASDGRHILDHLLPLHQRGDLKIVAAFGPQHGIWGHTQDNMIEWEGYEDARTGLRFHSLYGACRKPTPQMLEGIEVLVVDIVDVGARYYTFVWTLALCIKACRALGIEVVVLDRVNPINGVTVEGTVLDPAFDSFVGLYPLPTRHGMTAGEIARYVEATQFPGAKVTVVGVEGWDRAAYHDETGLPWAIPSPNMPTVDTAVVYPGMCLLEATNVSEGRGTTRPFEICGAAWLDSWAFCDALNAEGLPGVYFRPFPFQPTFHKHAGAYCGGAFLHVFDRAVFEPVLAGVAVMQAAHRCGGGKFAWNPPPYEYEEVKRPIDILAGNAWLAEAVDNLWPLPRVRERMAAECAAFEATRRAIITKP